MADLEITKNFSASPEKVFAAVTNPDSLLQWWGPEGVTVRKTDLVLDLTRTGPWGSVMQNAEGAIYKVTGQVTHVDPPRSVGFTWAWHDDDGTRGHESHVTFTIEPSGDGGSIFRLSHIDLADEDSAQNHNGGWTSSLSKLPALISD